MRGWKDNRVYGVSLRYDKKCGNWSQNILRTKSNWQAVRGVLNLALLKDKWVLFEVFQHIVNFIAKSFQNLSK